MAPLPIVHATPVPSCNVLEPEEIQIIGLSLKVGAWVVLISLIPGLLVAWCLARWQSRWRLVLHGMVLLPLVLPPVVTGYLLLGLLGRSSWLGGLWYEWTGSPVAYTTTGCIVAAAVVGFPLLVESIRLSMVAIDVRLENVSRSLGWGRIATFWKVTIPLCIPGILAGITLAFARSLGEFGATIILAGNIEGETRQIPLAIYDLLNQPGKENAVARLSIISVALALLSLLGAALLRKRANQQAGQS